MIAELKPPFVWWESVMGAAKGRCAVTGERADECHHVVTRQQLRRRGLGHLVWDERNGLAVSHDVHRRHTLAVERIPRRCLRPENLEFADEHGLGYLVERYYPEAA